MKHLSSCRGASVSDRKPSARHAFVLATCLFAIPALSVQAAEPPLLLAQTYSTTATRNTLSPDADWARRAGAPGVVKAVGFDDIHDWAAFSFERTSCNSAYQVMVDGKLAGCRNNAWDPVTRASGKGSIRFDILSQTSGGAAGSMAIPFGAYDTRQFGANTDMWLSWRQRMTSRLYQGYRTTSGGLTGFKQAIIAQGDMPIPGTTRTLAGYACSEAEVVIVSTKPYNGQAHTSGYIECGRYVAFRQTLSPGTYAGDAKGSSVYTLENMRKNTSGLYNCIYFPTWLDRSGCATYVPDQWVTYMVHLKIGPEGTAVSSVSKISQPGYINSVFELYAAPAGQNFRLLHRQTGVVIPKGQYYIGGDAMLNSSYRSGWVPGNAHPKAKYGKVWLLPYMTDKDPTEVTSKASTWYDELIVSRCPIAAPGYPIPSNAPAGCIP